MRAGRSCIQSGGLEPETMTKRTHFDSALAACLVTGLLAGCGQFKMPEATTPPQWAVLGERAPAFTVFAEDPLLPGKLDEVSSGDFKGSVLVAMGAEAGFAGELLPWLEVLEGLYGPPRRPASSVGADEDEKDAGRYCVLLIVERAEPRKLSRFKLVRKLRRLKLVRKLRGLKRVMPDEHALLIDPDGEFAKAGKAEEDRFGFVGEGPHIAVISADGTLLALVDGPVSERRSRRLVEAMDRAFSLLDRKTPEKSATPVDGPGPPP